MPGRWNPTTKTVMGFRFLYVPSRLAGRRQSAFLRRRMKITTPNKTAMTPAIRRIVVEFINVISFLPSLSANYMLSIIGIKSRTRRIMTGPIVTTKREGSTQKKIGKISFTASLAARSSALCRAMLRK